MLLESQVGVEFANTADTAVPARALFAMEQFRRTSNGLWQRTGGPVRRETAGRFELRELLREVAGLRKVRNETRRLMR